MLRSISPRTTVCLLLAGLCLVSLNLGCGSATDPKFAKLRGQYVLPEEPAEARTIAESQEAVGSGGDVVVVGRIETSTIDPWAKDQAAFVLSEAPLDATNHGDRPGHDAANCPFCKRRAAKADATALVQFRDDQGSVLPIDARTLLGLRDNQVVVVRGQGQVNEQGVLVISATGLHVRK